MLLVLIKNKKQASPSLYASTMSCICLLFLDAMISIRHLSFVPAPLKQSMKLNMKYPLHHRCNGSMRKSLTLTASLISLASW